jgi:hypothetical protein
MLNSVAPATCWSSACSITAVIGGAHRAFRGFNRHDRVLANDSRLVRTGLARPGTVGLETLTGLRSKSMFSLKG